MSAGLIARGGGAIPLIAIAALLGGGVAIAAGVLSQDEAIEAIDFNTLALLAGMILCLQPEATP